VTVEPLRPLDERALREQVDRLAPFRGAASAELALRG
jgi:hypothetical protein